jgi:hypothetical protein
VYVLRPIGSIEAKATITLTADMKHECSLAYSGFILHRFRRQQKGGDISRIEGRLSVFVFCSFR